MPKKMKIKRYNRIYRGSGNRNVRKIILWVVAALALFLVGFLLAEPIYQYFTGGNRSSHPSASQWESESSAPESESSQASVPEVNEGRAKGAVLPLDTLRNGNIDSFITYCKENAIEMVTIEAKSESGNVNYVSTDETVQRFGTFTGAVDLSAAVTKLKENNIKVYGLIHAFKDPLAPQKVDRASAVRYVGTDYLWLDKAQTNGGKPWLNPNGEQAQSYIRAMAVELCGMGFDGVILDSVQFPAGLSLDKADFGTLTSKEQVLAGFVASVKAAVGEKEVGLVADYTAFLGEQPQQYGADPSSFGADFYLPKILTANMTKAIQVGEETIENPSADPAGTIQKVLAALGTQKEWVPIVSGAPLTSAQITAELGTLERYLINHTAEIQ